MASRFRLDNGLTVLFEAQRAARVAAFQLWVKAGSADERPDQAGLAHLHEHMLFKGTERRGPGEIAGEIERHGGEINAWTSFDQTVYHVVIASQFARVGLDVLGDSIRRSAFDPAELSREVEVVCEEIKRADDMPSRRASRDLFATAYRVHPYQRPVLGWAETVRSFTRERVLEFYRRHYAPSNIVLAAVGDLDEARAREWAEEILGGDWGRSYPGRTERPPEPPQSGRRTLIRQDDVKEAHLSLAFPIPAVSHEDTPALDVLAMIAGQGEASRLVLEVKRKRSLVNEIHAFSYTPQDPGLFVVSLGLPASSVPPALEHTVKTLVQLRRALVTEDELQTVKAIVESEAVYNRETVQGLARKLGFYETAVGGIEEEARYYQRIAALTPERILEVAERYLRFEDGIVTGLVPPGTDLSEHQAVEVIDRACAEPSGAPHERRSQPHPPPEPLAVTSALSARPGAGGLLVHRLSSGAQVVIREESSVPLFAVRASFLGGVRYETDQDNGKSTLLARMLVRGTPSRDAEEISHQIDRYSGSLSGQAGKSSVSLRAEFLSKHFHGAFDLFADCLLNPAFPEAELERERRLLLQDLLNREDKPSAVAFELFSRTLYQRHPYRLPQLGETASVEGLRREMLADYRQRHLDPSQLTLSVVGDVKADQVLALAEKHFGKAGPAAAPPPSIPPEERARGQRRSRKTLARQQTHLVFGFHGMRVTDAARRPLEVLSAVLSGQGGRLFVELRDKKSMAYSVSSMAMEGVDPGYFAVYIGTSPEKAEAALEGIQRELKRVREEKISPQELERAKRHLVGSHEIGLQRNGARAALLALDFLYGVGEENFARYDEQISAVTPEAVLDVAQRVIDFEGSALAVVGPEGKP